MTSGFAAAVAEWRAVVGAQNVITAEPELRRRETATLLVHRTIPAIVRPGSVEEVQACLRTATRHRVPIYPVSSGKNWGYGSSLPAADGSTLLDLARMNRILHVDERLGYVTLEPGVTQRQLHGCLTELGSHWWMDATGSSPECSVIGNTVERGFGHTPYGDHFGNACALQAVLADGDVVETGFAQFPGALAAGAYRWGVGPAIDGLFSQSGLGVVTRMTLWLMPAPEYFQAFFFKIERDAGLERVIDALRTLRLEGTLRNATHLANDYKVLTSISQYPWREAAGRTPLPDPVRDRLSSQWHVGAWSGSGALYGTRAQVAAARRRLVRLLGPEVDNLRFLDDRRLRLAARMTRPYQWLTGLDVRRLLAIMQPVYGLMKGIPTDATLASVYWRKRFPPPVDADPDRDGCGLIWCAPVAPAEAGAVRDMVEIARKVFQRYPFEPAMSMTLRTERSVDNVIAISYDRDVAGEDERALACHDELLQRLAESGFYPYRMSIHAQGRLRSRKPGSERFLRRLRQAIDPAGILAPGRYP